MKESYIPLGYNIYIGYCISWFGCTGHIAHFGLLRIHIYALELHIADVWNSGYKNEIVKRGLHDNEILSYE